ncbi:MAG: hypothetical protein U0002_06150 [Thermoanaerobaculia bacterium]
MSQTPPVGSTPARGQGPESGAPAGRAGNRGGSHGEFARLLEQAGGRTAGTLLPVPANLPRRRRPQEEEQDAAAGGQSQSFVPALAPPLAGLERGATAGPAPLLAGGLEDLAGQLVRHAELIRKSGATELRLGLDAHEIGIAGARIARDAAGRIAVALETRPGAATAALTAQLPRLATALAERGLETRTLTVEPAGSAPGAQKAEPSRPEIAAAQKGQGSSFDGQFQQGQQSRGRAWFDHPYRLDED